MKLQSIFTDSGWNFTDTWIIDSNLNDGYPYLRAFIIPPTFMNLLSNAGAESGSLSGWTVSANGGNGWAVA